MVFVSALDYKEIISLTDLLPNSFFPSLPYFLAGLSHLQHGLLQHLQVFPDLFLIFVLTRKMVICEYFSLLISGLEKSIISH